MISFEPFWTMLHKQGITTYDLEHTYEFNPAEISRLKHNHNFTLQFINRLCFLFQCQPSDIVIYTEAGLPENLTKEDFPGKDRTIAQ